MKVSLISGLILTSLLSLNASAGTLNEALKGSGIINSSKNDVYSGVKFQYFDQNDRIQIIEDLMRSVSVEYAPLQIKQKRIGLDLNKIKSEAIAAEKNIANILLSPELRSNPEAKAKVINLQAKSNMDFLDRMQLLVAKFQDSHFSLQERIPRPFIYTGIRLRRVAGFPVLAAVDSKFLALAQKVSGADLSAIAPGDIVVSIDGVKVEDKISELKNYIAGSSDEFRDSQAIRSLTVRNMLYPTKNYMTIEFARAGIYKLPVMVNNPTTAVPRLDALEYLKGVNIQTDTSSLGVVFDKSTRQFIDSPTMMFDGYSPWKMHFNLKGLTEYTADNGTPGMRTGYYMKNGKTYGVLQLLTFYTKNLNLGQQQIKFLDAIRGFVAELKENGMPLILDLRNNPGGNGSFPNAVLSILSKTNEIYGGATNGYRMTSYIRQLEEPSFYQELVAEDVSYGLTIDALKEVMDNAITNKKDYMPMVSYSDVANDQVIRGFDNKIVALVTADCISACDMMSSLLKASGRAKIIGTHSNGTGAGFISTQDLNTEWTDSLRVFSSQIPNHLFGIPGAPGVRIFGENSVMEMDLENAPTKADVDYVPMPIDFSKNNIGWLNKAVEVLESMK